jgi:hypothetical protein
MAYQGTRSFLVENKNNPTIALAQCLGCELKPASEILSQLPFPHWVELMIRLNNGQIAEVRNFLDVISTQSLQGGN